jgi:hypothetical protein
MSKLLNVYKSWRRTTGKSQAGSVNIVAQRFLQAFMDHGVEASQIPRLLPQVNIGDLQSPEKLLAVISPEILDQTALLFGIRSQWLEGVDDKIYEHLACYKRPAILLEHLAVLLNGKDNFMRFPMRVLSTTKQLDNSSDSQQLMAPVLVEKIAELGEEEIYRYHIYIDGFNWGYAPTRIELKALARIVYKQLHSPVPLFVISAKEMQDVLEGKLIPRQFLDGCLLSTPSLEDFALTNEESAIANEVEEMPAVLHYIEEHKLQNFIFDIPATPPPAEPPASSVSSVPPEKQEKPKKSGKRAQAQTEIWEPARAVAGILWADKKELLNISEVVRRIKMMPHLKASGKSLSAIHKNIVDLAPEGIGGKSGRKPKKSP